MSLAGMAPQKLACISKRRCTRDSGQPSSSATSDTVGPLSNQNIGPRQRFLTPDR